MSTSTHNPVMMNPAAAAAAARYIEREYGESGYVLGCVYAGRSIHFFQVRCSDGSEFFVVSDRWENARRVQDDESVPYIREVDGLRPVGISRENGQTWLTQGRDL